MVACPTHYIYKIIIIIIIIIILFWGELLSLGYKKIWKILVPPKLRIKPLIPPREKLKKCGNKTLKLVTLLRMDLIFKSHLENERVQLGLQLSPTHWSQVQAKSVTPNVFTLTSLFAADGAKRKGQKYFFMKMSKHFSMGILKW
jgi:hypothetical protein